MRTRALLSLLFAMAAVAVGACAASKPKDTAQAPPPPQTQPLGAACAIVEGELARSTCAEGLVCGQAPGGMCTVVCGAGIACPEGSACAEGPTFGELCVKACKSDVDCRGDEGYVCDATWSACVPPQSASPKLGSCAAPAPKRKKFGKVVAVTDKSKLGLYQTEPTAGVLPSGDVVALYLAMGRTGEPSNLGSTVVDKAGTAQDGALKSDKQQAAAPRVVVDAAGKAHAVWLDWDGAAPPEKNMRLAYSTSKDGKEWSPPVALHEDADCPATAKGCLSTPMITIGPSKEDAKKEAIYVAYLAPAKNELRVRRSLDGGATFEPAVAAGAGTLGDLEVSADGDVHLATTTTTKPDADRFGDASTAVEHRRSADGGKTFSPPVRVSSAEEPVPYWFAGPQVAYDAKKKLLYVVYPAGTPDGKWNVMLATSKDGVTFTTVQVNDDVSCASHMAPSMVLDQKSGKVHVMWIENRTDQGGVAYAQCQSGGKKCGTNEAINDAPFASYSFARGSPKWTGDHTWLVADAKNKKLHAVWAQTTADEAGGQIARVFHAAGKLD